MSVSLEFNLDIIWTILGNSPTPLTPLDSYRGVGGRGGGAGLNEGGDLMSLNIYM